MRRTPEYLADPIEKIMGRQALRWVSLGGGHCFFNIFIDNVCQYFIALDIEVAGANCKNIINATRANFY